MTTTVQVGVGPVSPADVVAVARTATVVELVPDALQVMTTSRLAVEELALSEIPVYGISTGFGALATRHIHEDMRTRLQKSLVRSHAAGSGPLV